MGISYISYSVYSDGLIEQEIFTPGTTSGGYNTLYYPVVFSNSNYCVNYTPIYNSSNSISWRVLGSEKTATYFKVYTSTNINMNITAKGY